VGLSATVGLGGLAFRLAWLASTLAMVRTLIVAAIGMGVFRWPAAAFATPQAGASRYLLYPAPSVGGSRLAPSAPSAPLHGRQGRRSAVGLLGRPAQELRHEALQERDQRHLRRTSDLGLEPARCSSSPWCWASLVECASPDLTIHVPTTDLRSGSVRKWWEVAAESVYAFHLLCLQQAQPLGRTRTARKNYARKQSTRLSAYLTPGWSDILRRD